MATGRYWSVDELAARKLLAALELAETDALVDQVARQFAEHRMNIAAWAAEKVHAGLIATLEEASPSTLAHHNEDWARGFRSAEELVITTSPQELLDIEPDQPRSQGQILRSLVRQAKKS